LGAKIVVIQFPNFAHPEHDRVCYNLIEISLSRTRIKVKIYNTYNACLQVRAFGRNSNGHRSISAGKLSGRCIPGKIDKKNFAFFFLLKRDSQSTVHNFYF